MSSVTKVRQVALLDLVAQHKKLREEVLAELLPLIDSQRFIMGPAVGELECDLAGYLGVQYAIGCANGSDALLLAWIALGIQPGDKIITTPFSFFATASSIARLGAVPVFVDVDERTFNLDAAQVREALEKDPTIKGIQPVHLFGGAADMGPLLELGRRYEIPVVEDAAQAIGAEWNGQRCGAMGEIGCFSFYPGKNLGAYGDAGLLTTNTGTLAEKLMKLRVHGGKNKYFHEYIGINSRLDTLQAAVLRVKLKYLDVWTAARQDNANYYERGLAASGANVITPLVAPYQNRHVFNQYTLLVDNRDDLKQKLATVGIGTEIYYPLPLHLQECFAYLGYREDSLPVAEKLAGRVLSIPVHPELSQDDLDYVIEQIAALTTTA
ncbi:MAG: DegT/DnrJ/EryC1/StrS family aminotransferase [Bryobacter sp.]